MKQEKLTAFEQWRWRINRKVAEFIHQPDDINLAELEAMIENYRNYHKLRGYMNFNNQ